MDYEMTLELPNGEIQEILIPEETKILEIAQNYSEEYDSDIILAMVNGKLRELNKEVDRSGNMSFVTVTDRDGKKTYRRSVMLLLQKAVQKIRATQIYGLTIYQSLTHLQLFQAVYSRVKTTALSLAQTQAYRLLTRLSVLLVSATQQELQAK